MLCISSPLVRTQQEEYVLPSQIVIMLTMPQTMLEKRKKEIYEICVEYGINFCLMIDNLN